MRFVQQILRLNGKQILRFLLVPVTYMRFVSTIRHTSFSNGLKKKSCNFCQNIQNQTNRWKSRATEKYKEKKHSTGTSNREREIFDAEVGRIDNLRKTKRHRRYIPHCFAINNIKNWSASESIIVEYGGGIFCTDRH